jgi:hypothetical protein
MFLQDDRTAAGNDEDDDEISSADSNDGNALIDTEDIEEPENVSNSCQWREDFGSFDPESLVLLQEQSRHVAVTNTFDFGDVIDYNIICILVINADSNPDYNDCNVVEVSRNGKLERWELRAAVSSSSNKCSSRRNGIRQTVDDWNGVMHARHGGDFPSWWKHHRFDHGWSKVFENDMFAWLPVMFVLMSYGDERLKDREV